MRPGVSISFEEDAWGSQVSGGHSGYCKGLSENQAGAWRQISDNVDDRISPGDDETPGYYPIFVPTVYDSKWMVCVDTQFYDRCLIDMVTREPVRFHKNLVAEQRLNKCECGLFNKK